MKVVRHGLVFLCDKAQAIKSHISTIFAIFILKFPQKWLYPLHPLILNELRIADFSGLCVTSLRAISFEIIRGGMEHLADPPWYIFIEKK